MNLWSLVARIFLYFFKIENVKTTTKQTHRHREQIGSCLRCVCGGGGGTGRGVGGEMDKTGPKVNK